MHTPNRRDEELLDELFRAYREACPTPEASANFMPQLWERIEARQRFSFFVRRMASGFVTAAVALTFAMAVYLYTPHTGSAFYSESYVEALASGHAADTAEEYVEPVRFDLSEPAGQL